MERSPDFERRVCAAAPEFEMRALLDLLESRGYESIRFRGARTRCFRASRIAAVRFDDPRPDWVTIVVNLGLLSNQSPLPDYFEKMLDYGIVDGRLEEFLEGIDHPLLKQRFEVERGRNSAWLLPGWAEAEQSLLGVMDVRSPSTIDGIMRRAFPELGVIVRRGAEESTIRVPSVIVNQGRFGYSAFGGEAIADVDALSITLISEDTNTESGERWEQEATRRLNEWVLPSIEGSGIALRVTLEIDESPRWIKLDGASQVGYDRFASPDADGVRHAVVLWGWMSQASPETESVRP